MRNDSGVQFGKRRGETWTYRREVPADVRAAIGLREWTKGLGRIGKSAARIEIAKLAGEHDKLIERARAGETFVDPPVDVEKVEREARALLRAPEEDQAAVEGAYEWNAMERAIDAHDGDLVAVQRAFPTREAVFEKFGTPHAKALANAMQNGGRVIPDHVTIRELYAWDLKVYGARGRDERPYLAAVRSFAGATAKLDIREIRAEDVQAWIDRSRRRGWTDSTIRRRAQCLAAMTKRWFKAHEIHRLNPFAELGLGAGTASDRVPFNVDHLKAIDTHLAAGGVPPALAHIIKLLKCTGAGPSEICGLEVADVDLNDAVPHIWIRPNRIRGVKRKKADKSNVRERQIPLVGDALEAMREAMKAPAGIGVFYNPMPSPNPRKAGPQYFDDTRPSNRINAVLREAGIPKSPRLSAYSFRHGVKQALVQAGARDDLRRYLMGHAGHDVHDRYGAPEPLMIEARDALTAAMGKLGLIKLSVYREDELIGE